MTFVLTEKKNDPVPLLDVLESAVKSPGEFSSIPGLLRALGRPLLSLLESRRVERITPVEKSLRYAQQRLRRGQAVGSLAEEPAYLLGRVDALLDMCALAVDRSVSDGALTVARREHAASVLDIVREGEARPKTMAEQLGISQASLLNLLRPMETAGLICRRHAGQAAWVSLGPLGEAVLEVVKKERVSAGGGKGGRSRSS